MQLYPFYLVFVATTVAGVVPDTPTTFKAMPEAVRRRKKNIVMKLISITRIIIIATLGMFALLLFLGQETDESNTAFILRFIVDKALACGIAYSAYRLYKRWSKIDPWFMAYNQKIDNEYNG